MLKSNTKLNARHIFMNYKIALLVLFLTNTVSPVMAMIGLLLDQKGVIVSTSQDSESYLESVKKKTRRSGIRLDLLHEAAERGHVGALAHLLTKLKEKKRPDINEVLNGRTPLYIACEKNKGNSHIPAIKFLLDQPNIQPNIVCNNETVLTYAALIQSNQLFPLLLRDKNVDLYKTNKSGQTYLYCIFHNTRLSQVQDHRDTIKSAFLKGTQEEQQHFLDEQLFCAAKMLTLGISTRPSSQATDISNFLKICVLMGADLNKRNKKGQRPVDVAEELYYWATKTVYHKDLPTDRIDIYHSFLRETPFISDGLLWQILKNVCPSSDACRYIFKFHTILTIHRKIAINQPTSTMGIEFRLLPSTQQNKLIQQALDDVYNQYGSIL